MKLLCTLTGIFFFMCSYSQTIELWSMTLIGSDGMGALIKADADGENFEVAHKFRGCFVRETIGNLLEISPGEFIGISSNGANLKNGSIFRYRVQDQHCEVLYDFPRQNGYPRPGGYLVKHGNGKVYGTTTSGGAHLLGSIFEFNPANDSTKVVLHGDSHLVGIIYSKTLTIGPGGDLYGMSNFFKDSLGSTIYSGRKLFCFNPQTNSLTFLDTLYGAEGYGSEFLTYASNGKFYGSSYTGGTFNKGVLFEFDPLSNTTSVLHNFNGADGESFKGMLVEGPSGRLFGMTNMGGSAGKGLLYEYDLIQDTFIVRQHFTGSLYGAHPAYFSLLKAGNNILYGVTHDGGSGDKGLLFSYNPANNSYNVLHYFSLSPEIGYQPEGGLIQGSDQYLWGMATTSGAKGKGSIFRYSIPGDSISLVQSFHKYDDGAFPFGQLLLHDNGKLYGGMEAPYGPNNTYGGLFSFDPISRDYNLVHVVDEEGGYSPTGYHVSYNNGLIYGIMQYGGIDTSYPGGCGVIYSYDPASNVYSVERKLIMEEDGCGSHGGLVKSYNGLLYGCTSIGGNGRFGKGVFFSFNPADKTFNVLVDLNDSTGHGQLGKLWQLPNGKIYGTMIAGAQFGQGCIFEYNPLTDHFSIVYNFKSAPKPETPMGGLFPSQGNTLLYGMTAGGGTYAGDIYSFNPLSKQFNIEFSGFMDTIGSISGTPAGGLIRASNGNFYGHSGIGGKNDFGNFFEFDPLTKQLTVKHEYDTRALKPRNTMWVEINGDPIGIAESEGKNAGDQLFSIHPNPATDKLIITLSKDLQDGELVLFDLKGQKIKNLGSIKQNKSIDVTELESGMYFIRLQSNHRFSTLRFVKN